MKMKHLTLILPSAAVLAMAVLPACSGKPSETQAPQDGITEFAIDQTLLSGERIYRVETPYDTTYLDLYTSLQWPEKLGSVNIATLRDSISRFAYADTVATSPRKAVERFLADTSLIEGATSVTQVDSLPADVAPYFNNVMASVMEVNEEMVTYRVVNTSYTGGAHPNTCILPFTYAYETGQVLDISNMFVASVKTDSIMAVIKPALARQYGVGVDNLEKAGFFAAQITEPGRPYIADNVLYFHYNPYEIGPYSMGAIDVAVYPYELEGMLRPEVARLFDTGL